MGINLAYNCITTKTPKSVPQFTKLAGLTPLFGRMAFIHSGTALYLPNN
jgi:hypothetical protein